MFATDVLKDLFGGPGASVGHVIEPLADSFLRLRAGGDVEQALVTERTGYIGNTLYLVVTRERSPLLDDFLSGVLRHHAK